MSLRSTFIGGVALTGLAAFGTVAMADGMPRYGSIKDAPIAAAPMTWTGLYFGLHGGYAWSDTTRTIVVGNPPFPPGTTSSGSADGWLGGVQAGYNWQFSPNWLIGIEGDYSWTDIQSSSAGFSTVTAPVNFTTNRFQTNDTDVESIATLTGRLGYTAGSWMLYVKGGAAWLKRDTSSLTVNPLAPPTSPAHFRASSEGEDTFTGWTVGTGLEWAFTRNLSFKVEYDYLQFSDTVQRVVTYNPLFPAGANPVASDVDIDVHAVKVGLNYRFN